MNQPPPQQPWPRPQGWHGAAQPPRSEGQRILGLSVGVFVGIIAAVVVLCGGAVALFAVFAVLGAADEAASRPTAEIVTCELVHVAAWQMAEVTWKVENNDNREREWYAHITVHDGTDTIVGEGGAQVIVAAGDTRTIESEILLIAPGRELTPGEQSCNIELKDSFLD